MIEAPSLTTGRSSKARSRGAPNIVKKLLNGADSDKMGRWYRWKLPPPGGSASYSRRKSVLRIYAGLRTTDDRAQGSRHCRKIHFEGLRERARGLAHWLWQNFRGRTVLTILQIEFHLPTE